MQNNKHKSFAMKFLNKQIKFVNQHKWKINNS